MSKTNSRAKVLCCLENIKEVINKKWFAVGTLSLLQQGNLFCIHWAKLDGSKCQNITAIFDFEKYKPQNQGKDTWNANEEFLIPTSSVKFITFNQVDNFTHFSIQVNSNDNIRVFQISDDDHVPIIMFLQQLIRFGICVPSIEGIPSISSPYNLLFYKSAHSDTFLSHPAYIQLNTDEFDSLAQLWDRVIIYYTELILSLNKSLSMPYDPEYPLRIASRAIHKIKVELIRKEIEGNMKGKYEDVTEANYRDMFDSSGKLKDPHLFKERLFHANTDPSILPFLLPFILGLYPLDTTQQERDDLMKALTEDYNVLSKQLDLLQDVQLDNHEKLASYFKIIDNDVKRTDRNLPAFKRDDAIGLKILAKFLKMYVLYNPPISYLQGMNDLCVPILLSYFPKWSIDGVPINDDGTPIEDYEKTMPLMFWCFESMLRNTNHTALLQNVTGKSPEISNAVNALLEKISPLCDIWLKRNNLDKLLWCYSEFILLFKRSFPTIWPTWIQFHVSPSPPKFLVLFLTAMLIDGFDYFAQLPDTSMTVMMDAFPKVLAKLDAKEIGEIALWVYNNYMKDKEEKIELAQQKNISESEDVNFDFFKPLWK